MIPDKIAESSRFLYSKYKEALKGGDWAFCSWPKMN